MQTSDAVTTLRDMVSAGWRTRVIFEAVKSGLIEAMTETPEEADAIAARSGLDAPAVFRVLRALSTLSLCRHEPPSAFALTPMGALLKADDPQSQRGHALNWGGRIMDSLATIGHTLKTGEPGRGNGDFAALNSDRFDAEAFNRAMAEQSRPVARLLAQVHDFRPYKRVMDVGGGYGGSLVEILAAFPHLEGVIYDLPAVEKGALPYLQGAGEADRARFVGGSFFDSVAREADCLILKYILHDWSDAECATILANCRAAMDAGDHLLVVERIMPDVAAPGHEDVVRADMVMMPINGRERTLSEYDAFARKAGFRIASVEPLSDGCSVMDFVAA